MRILISNDDGYLAPGINALAEALQPIADIVVVAPDSNRSGASNSLTLDRPLSVHQAANGFYFVNGTPTDCVHVALTGLLDHVPDLVVSGINNGPNMGDDTLYSGTVAAATEGYLFGVPAMAFSQGSYGWANVDAAARVARDLVQRYLELLERPYLLNVNIPNLPYEQLGPLTPTRLGRRHQALIKADCRRAAAALLVASRAGDVYEDSAHQTRRQGEEVRTIVPVDVLHVDEAQIDFVDERRRL